MINNLIKIVLFIVNVPAKLKGVKFGENSYFGPGYDFLNVDLEGIKLGNNVLTGRNAWIQKVVPTAKIIIDDSTNIGRNCVLSSKESIHIGKNCLLSFGVSILDHDHDFSDLKVDPMHAGTTIGKPVSIGDGCFIGAGTFILKGVTLGSNCIVGCNSVVTKSFDKKFCYCG